MNIGNEELIKIFKKVETKNNDDSRTILKHNNRIIFGNEFGIVLSKIKDNSYEVFLHAKIDKNVISQILYEKYDVEELANIAYDKFLSYINNNDLESIINECQK